MNLNRRNTIIHSSNSSFWTCENIQTVILPCFFLMLYILDYTSVWQKKEACQHCQVSAVVTYDNGACFGLLARWRRHNTGACTRCYNAFGTAVQHIPQPLFAPLHQLSFQLCVCFRSATLGSWCDGASSGRSSNRWATCGHRCNDVCFAVVARRCRTR